MPKGDEVGMRNVELAFPGFLSILYHIIPYYSILCLIYNDTMI